jgi:hypothetical protein
MDLPVPSPSEIAGGISKQGLYYVIGVLCVVVVWLTWRIFADRDTNQAQLTALAQAGQNAVAENGKQTVLHNRMIDELREEVRDLRRALGKPAPRPRNKPPGEKTDPGGQT